jgi:hypothetical protein
MLDNIANYKRTSASIRILRPGQVAAWAVEAGDETDLHWIGTDLENDLTGRKGMT